MPQTETLHILNGQAMYHIFKQTGFLQNEMMIPFNEAMCFGNTSSENLFSQEFVAMRAKVHHVTPAQYNEITLTPLQPLFDKKYTNIALWFDFDMFCQINLLTILAWLDQSEYNGTIDLHLVDENYQPTEKFTLTTKGYFQLYQQVLIEKIMPDQIHPPPLKKGVELYLNYLHKESSLMLYIQNHQNLSEKQLVRELLINFKEYGLGDTQYLEIIKNYQNEI